MFGVSPGGIIAGILIWVLWAGLALLAFLNFIRGMRALTEIPHRLERIEHLLEARLTSETKPAPRQP